MFSTMFLEKIRKLLENNCCGVDSCMDARSRPCTPCAPMYNGHASVGNTVRGAPQQ